MKTAFSKIVLALIAAAFSIQGSALAAKPEKIERRVNEALSEFRGDIGGADEVLARGGDRPKARIASAPNKT